MPNDQASFAPMSVPCGQPPDCKLGRRAIHVLIDFTLGLSFKLDLSQVQSQGGMDSVQTLYIDNASNTGSLTILMGLTNQSIILPAGAQAYMPVLQGNPPIIQFTSTAAVPVNIQLLNFFIPPAAWYTTGLPVNDLTLAGIIANGAANVNVIAGTVTGAIDRSGTIALGGTRQQLLAANASRKRWLVSNPSTATEILQISYVTNVAGLIDLQPGATWSETDASVSGDEIWVVAATLGHAFTAYEW
ncbi:MAG TPA: DUF1859 domain-containing protein [Candidatus Paceibacterota bacterium]